LSNDYQNTGMLAQLFNLIHWVHSLKLNSKLSVHMENRTRNLIKVQIQKL